MTYLNCCQNVYKIFINNIISSFNDQVSISLGMNIRNHT